MRLFFIPTLFILSMLTACAPTIGNKMDVQKASFLIGQTTQNDVVIALGLPNEMKKSKALKQEYWAYSKEPELMGVIIAVPDGTGTSATTHSIRTGEDADYEFDDAAAIYVFDAQKTLIDVRYPLKDK
ncbi:MAG: hypothetical protein JXR18_04660 [Neptuniibacter sp.]